MFVIIAYDVGEERVQKVCKYLRRYLPRVQNSVFEGELSEAKLERMKVGLQKIIRSETDAVLLWAFRDDRWVDRQVMGREKLPVSNVI